jgi:hypothetical protein
MPAWLSILVGGLLTAAPQYVTLLPHEVQAGLTGVFAVATGIFHLYATVPGTVTGIKIP